MLTRRKISKVRQEAERWYSNGIHWEGGSKVAAPGYAPYRIAFDAGSESERERRRTRDAGETDCRRGLFFSRGMPLDVWIQVFAAEFGDYR